MLKMEIKADKNFYSQKLLDLVSIGKNEQMIMNWREGIFRAAAILVPVANL